ncbi:unnamed protein product [Rodentolepis nana]|uniref:RRM domain-containing protein n=1 Tax=Rodentolepis nana TaxID=102285 RepID=A0A0R3T4M8_RODNA|nr:unnamed protein product [Rodentolepis nana]
MDNCAEIDLYDNIEEDFVQETNESSELYDDIAPPAPKVESTKSETKWTTDVDITEAFNGIGIRDILEIKFHENRTNGQSKGFCIVVFSSEASVKLGMDKIKTIQIHGNTPVLTLCTKQALAQFEKNACTDTAFSNSTGTGLLGASSNIRSASSNGRLPPPLMSTPALAPAQLGFSVNRSSSLMGRATSNRDALLHLNIPNIPPGIQNLLMPGFNMPPSLSNSGTGLIQNPNILPGATGSNAHINPNFLNQTPNQVLQVQLGSGMMRSDQFSNSIMQNYHSTQSSNISDVEFETIMEKNRTVASTAINRALQDTAVGNHSRAIETLVTAIALIGQSKIANDDRCKMLINSLKDTKHSIEDQSYSSKSRGSRHRRRSYSRSGSEGDYGEDEDYRGGSSRRRHRRSRPRSRSRTPRGRDSDRHRHSSSNNGGSGGGDRDYYNSGKKLAAFFLCKSVLCVFTTCTNSLPQRSVVSYRHQVSPAPNFRSQPSPLVYCIFEIIKFVESNKSCLLSSNNLLAR